MNVELLDESDQRVPGWFIVGDTTTIEALGSYTSQEVTLTPHTWRLFFCCVSEGNATVILQIQPEEGDSWWNLITYGTTPGSILVHEVIAHAIRIKITDTSSAANEVLFSLSGRVI